MSYKSRITRAQIKNCRRSSRGDTCGGERSDVCPHHRLVLVLVVVAAARGQRGFGLVLISNLITGEKLAELLDTGTQRKHDVRKTGLSHLFLSLQVELHHSDY